MAMTDNRDNDTPAQSQVERDKTVATNESSSDELGEVKLLWSLLATDRLMISFDNWGVGDKLYYLLIKANRS